MAGPYPFDHLAGRTTFGKSPQGKIVPGRFNPASLDPTPWGARYNLTKGFDQALEGPEAAVAIYELQAAVWANAATADKLRGFYGLGPASFDNWDHDFVGQQLMCNDALYLAGMVPNANIWHDFRAVLDSVAPPIQPPPPPPPPVNPPTPAPVTTSKLSPANQRAEEFRSLVRDGAAFWLTPTAASEKWLRVIGDVAWPFAKVLVVEAIRFYREIRNAVRSKAGFPLREIPQEDR